MLKILRVLGALSLLALSFAACGDDDSTNADASSRKPAAGVDVAGDLDIDLAGVDQACKDGVQSMADAGKSVLEAFGDGIDDVDGLIDELDTFVRAAPEEIRADAKVVFDGYADFLKVYGTAGLDFVSGDAPSREVLHAISDAGETLSTPAFQKASDHVTAWFTEHCGG